jgi:uncharacterized membrane protein
MGADNRARAVALLLATFVAGAIAGAAVWPRVAPRGLEIRRLGGWSGERGEVESERIPLPLETLGLSSDERTRLRAIARRWRPRAANEFEEVRRRVSDMENGMFAEMLCALTPEQRDKYLKLTQDQHYDTTTVTKRFALVRANRCSEVFDSANAPR